MNPHDEEQIAALLKASETDAAPPDLEALARLRTQSTEVFSATEATVLARTKRRAALVRQTRWLGAAAAIVVVSLGLYFWLAPGPSGVALGQVLENMENAPTLHARLAGGGRQFEFWHSRSPRCSRWDHLDGHYRVAHGATLWTVNEKANEAIRWDAQADVSFSVKHFLAFLGLTAEKARVEAARPVERIHDGNRDLLIYRTEIPGPKGKIWLEAQVNAETLQLLSMRTTVDQGKKNEISTDLIVLAYDEPIDPQKFVIADTLTEDGRIGKVTEVQGIVTIKPVLHERWTPVRQHLVLKPGDWLRTDARGANATALRLVKQTGVILGPKTLVELIGPKKIRLIEGEIEIDLSGDDEIDLLGPNAKAVVIRGREVPANLPGWFKELDTDRDGQVALFEWRKGGKNLDEFAEWDLNDDGFITAEEALKHQAVLAGDQAIVKGKQLYCVEKGRVVRMAKAPPWLLGFKGATANETLGSLVALVDGRNVPLSVGYHKVAVDIRDQIARTVVEESFVNHTDAVLEGVFYFPLPQDASISGFGMWIGDNLVEADVVEKQRAREIYETILRERRDPGLLEWSGGNIFKARVFPIPAHSEKRIKITYTQVLPLKGSRYRYSYGLQSELLQQHPLRELTIYVKVNSVVPLKSVTSPTHPTRDARSTHSAHVEFTAQEYTPTRDFEVVVETEGRQADVVMIPHRRGDDGYFMLQLTPPGASGDWDRPILPNGEPLQVLILADTSASIDASQRATQATFIGALLASLSPRDTFNLATCDVTCDWAFAQSTKADAANVSTARDFLARRSSLGWTDLDRAFTSVVAQSSVVARSPDRATHVIYVGDGIVTSGDADPIAFTKRLRRSVHGHGGTFHAVTLGSSYEPAVLKAIASLGSGSMRKISGEQGPTAVARELLGEIAQPALRDIKVEFQGFKVARVYPDSLANIPAGAQQILVGRYLPDGQDQSGEVIVTGTQGGKPVRFSTRASFKDAEQGNSFIPRLWARMHLDSLLEQGSSDTIKDEIIALSEEFQIITPFTSLLVLETDADRERFKVKRRFQMRDGERFFADGRDNAAFDLAQKQRKLAGDWRTALRRSVLSELARLGREPGLFQRESPYLWAFAGAYQTDSLADWATSDGMGGEKSLGLVPVEKNSTLGDLFANSNVRDIQGEVVDIDDGALPISSEFDAQRFGVDKESNWLAEHVEDRLIHQREMAVPMPFFRPFDAFTRLQRARDHSIGKLFLGIDEDLDFKSMSGEYRTYKEQASRSLNYAQWLNALFPPLHGATGQPQQEKSSWPAAARNLLKSLLRTEQLAKMSGGLEISRQTDTFDVRWGNRTAHRNRLDLVAAKSWLIRSASDGGPTLVSWCDGKEVGIYSKAFQLGRVRAATPLDEQPPPPEVIDHPLTSLETYADYVPTLEPQGKDRTMLVLKYKGDSVYETHILIDTARHVILSIEDRIKGKITSKTQFDDFIEAAGSWWPRRIETTNDAGKRVAVVTQAVKALTLNEFDQQTKTELAGRAQVQLLHLPLPSLKDAKKALTAGKANFDDQFALLIHFLRSQQWACVFEHLQGTETLAPGKPGMRWLRSALLQDSRRHEDLRRRFQQDAQRLAKDSSSSAFFLGQYLVGQAKGVLQANEMLTLLDALKPLYDKQPAHVQARKSWLQMHAYNVAQTGRTDEALRLRKQLAANYPRDYSLQQEYAQALAGAGDYAAAYAWLTRVLVKDAKWLDHEEDALRTTYASFLQQQGRNADLVTYLALWVEQNPPSHSAYEQYLSALLKFDQIEKADALALRWLKDAEAPGELSPAAESRLNAAINFMLGDYYQLHTNRIQERWLAPLAQAALLFARHESRSSTAERILAQHQFQHSEEGKRVRKLLAGILIADFDQLSAEEIFRLVSHVQTEDAEQAAWDKIIAKLRQRWTSETKDEAKRTLGRALDALLSRQDTPNALLAFLRLQRQTGPEEYRAEYANRLLDRLLAQPWSAEIEAEAFSLLDKLSNAEDAGTRLFTAIAALHRLTDTLLESRIAAQTKLLAHLEKFTRTDLLKKQDEIRRSAREGLADRLRNEAAKQPKALAPWLLAESLYLDVSLDRNLKQAVADAWEFLGAAPPVKAIQASTIGHTLEDLLRLRYLMTLTNLAARTSAEPALVERLLQYFDQGIKAGADTDRWKLAKYRLLIARDRPRELEQSLRQWASQDDADSRWRIALGYLLAEQGKLREAIQQFEAVETADELGPSAYRALAGWYLVQNQREKHEHAAAAVYQTTPEHYLSQMIGIKLQPWQQREGRMPTEVDPEVMRMFAVLFDKSVAPERYLQQLQQFYQASHDFRLLASLPDAVVGHTAARVYPFVQRMQSVLNEVRDEATADEIVKRIAAVRPRAKTVVDQRALDLLEVLVERRAAEVQNQPGPHRDKALAALQRAFKREWSPGEPRLMADFLAGLGNVSQPALADEQLRQLKALHGDATPGSIDRLHIAERQAWTLRSYQRTADAIDVLQAALDEFQAAHDGVLPVTANDALVALIGSLEDAGHFARGEKILLAQLAHPSHAQQRLWLVLRIDELYHRALEKDGAVSLGKGLTLYQALNARAQKDLAELDPLKRYQLADLLCRVYRTAQEKKLSGVAADLKAFAFEIAPPLVKGLTNYHPSIVGTVAQTVHDLIGPREGIAFLLHEIDSEPRWLRYNNQDAWSRHGNTLAQWRWEAKDLGDVEGRLLMRVLAELRRDLEAREPRSRTIYHHGHERFWKEKTADFAKTAESVLAERSKSGPAVQYIADYFYWGLGKTDRAIEVMFVARNQKLLDEAGEAALVNFLQRENRYGESIPVLLPLVERRPTNLDYRVFLMRAYFRTGRQAELLALLKETDTFFHEKDRWGENPLNRLAHSTLQNELYSQSAAYFKELIPLHERTQPNRGIGNGTLSTYYAGLANSFAGLKKTPEAVEAAGGAIVAWGNQRDNRAKAIDTLKQVLLRAPDLDAFVVHFDQQKQDSAIVRKALGQAYREKKEHTKAIKQLQQAAQLQPHDAEVYQLLVASYDDVGDKAAAIKQLLQAAQQARRDFKLYEDLGNRYVVASQMTEAERAYTSIVEVQPSESESHTLLAEVREKQNRWADAIHHWEQVARLRALEPTGLLKLAAAQIHEKRWDAARKTLRKLDTRTWPVRFGNVHEQVRTLEERIAG